MVIDSIQVNPFQLPLQAWPMAPAYGASGPLAPQGLLGNWLSGLAGPAGQLIGGFFGQPQLGAPFGQTIGGPGGILPLQTVPLMAPVYGSGSLVPQGIPAPMVMPLVPLQATPTLVPSPAVLQAEQQALNDFLQEAAAGPIRKLHDYLDAHSQKYSQLAPCIPLVQQAAKAFGSHDYTQALAQVYQAYRYITALRTSISESAWPLNWSRRDWDTGCTWCSPPWVPACHGCTNVVWCDLGRQTGSKPGRYNVRERHHYVTEATTGDACPATTSALYGGERPAAYLVLTGGKVPDGPGDRPRRREGAS